MPCAFLLICAPSFPLCLCVVLTYVCTLAWAYCWDNLQCVFLLSIYHLESLRVRSGSLEALFAYLDDESLFSIGSLYSLVGKITDEVFTVFLEEVDVQLSQHTHLSKSLNLEDKGDGFSPLMADNPLLTSPAGGAPASAFLPNGRLSAVSSASLPPAERVDSSPRRCSSSSLSSGPSTPVTAAAGAAVVTQWKQQPVHDSSRRMSCVSVPVLLLLFILVD